MPNRFPPLAPQHSLRARTVAKQLPMPSLPLLDALIFAALIVLMRLS